MYDRLQPSKLPRFGKQRRRPPLSIDPHPLGRAWESRFDGGNRGAFIEPVHLRVGIEDGDPQGAQAGGDGGFAHADRTREANDKHHWRSMSASSRARSSLVTWGRTPNHFSKPGTAWCNSMPRPSTLVSPRALAAASRGVTSGP